MFGRRSFADFQPLDTVDGNDAYRRDRRIELKLTERSPPSQLGV